MSQVITNPPSTSFAARARAQQQIIRTPSKSSTNRRSICLDAVLMVPIYDERQQGADLLMIPVPDEKENRQQTQEPSRQESSPPQQKELPQPQPQLPQLPQLQQPQPQPQQLQQRHPRIDTPSARPPTPPPKPQLPLDCQDWEDYLTWRRTEAMTSTTATGKIPPAALDQRPLAAPKEDIIRGFEEWKEYLAQSRAASKRGARPLSIISTATCSTLGGGARSLKRTSMCSISSTKSGKPRSLRRCSRSRHLRAYYSEGSLSTARRGDGKLLIPSALSFSSFLIANQTSMLDHLSKTGPLKEAVVHVEHAPRGRQQLQPRQPSSRQSLRSSWASSCGPPPFPPPDKPLPEPPADLTAEALPVQQGERRTRKRNRSILDERERKRFHRVYWD